jgi:uncharacterized protein
VKRLIAWQNRLFERLRPRAAFEVRPQTTGFEHLRGRKHALLVTYRRSGEPVPTAVWFGLADGRLYVRTEAQAGKIKRIRRESRVLVAPCSMRAKPLGPAAEGRARVLPESEWGAAEAAIHANYGLGRRIYEGIGSRAVDLVYLVVEPARS